MPAIQPVPAAPAGVLHKACVRVANGHCVTGLCATGLVPTKPGGGTGYRG